MRATNSSAWKKHNYLFESVDLWFISPLKALFGLFINPVKPEYTIAIFIHYKPRIAVGILDL